MKQRPFGKTGLSVSEIGFGTWGIGGNVKGAMAYGPTDDAESARALRHAFDLGINFFDTANLYGFGHSEELLGSTFNDNRERVLLATKAGFADASGRQDFDPAHLRSSLLASLGRLRTGWVELLQLHSPSLDDLRQTAGLFEMLEQCRQEGLLRHVGLAARSLADALLAVQQFDFASVQVNFNLTDLRALENGLFDLCERRGVAVIVRTPLAFGFLTGKVHQGETFHSDDHRQRFSAGQQQKWRDAIQLLRDVFADLPGATPAQNALRFCLSFPAVSTVIPGMARVTEVEENAAASELPPLTARQIETVRQINRSHPFFEQDPRSSAESGLQVRVA